MASLKKLAGQTVWYGVSNIGARMLTYLLTPYFTYTLVGAAGKLEAGKFSHIYSAIPILNVLYTYGMETAFFRYSTTENNQKLYRTQLTSMLMSTLLFSAILILFQQPLSVFATVPDHPEYVGWVAAIIGLDAISALPYAKLRRDNRPRKYAFTKIIGIVIYVVTIVFLFSFMGDMVKGNPDGFLAQWYDRHWGTGFILFANILQAIVTLLLLYKEMADYRPEFDRKLWNKVMVYGFPILITGLAGVINDTLNRMMYTWMYPAPEKTNLRTLAEFAQGAVKLSVMIQLMRQAFQMAAEPFFFSISREKSAPDTYARVMKWFVIILAVMFLNVVLFMDIWKYFVGPEYRGYFYLVPVLMLSNIFLGIYYNLTVWYKLTDKTRFGTYITVMGAAVTIIFNWVFIPIIGIAACAWGTLLCYAVMMIMSYYLGQKHYPIPYETPKMIKYLVVMLAYYFIQAGVVYLLEPAWIHLLTGTFLFMLYLIYILFQERKELKGFPVIGKYIR